MSQKRRHALDNLDKIMQDPRVHENGCAFGDFLSKATALKVGMTEAQVMSYLSVMNTDNKVVLDHERNMIYAVVD